MLHSIREDDFFEPSAFVLHVGGPVTQGVMPIYLFYLSALYQAKQDAEYQLRATEEKRRARFGHTDRYEALRWLAREGVLIARHLVRDGDVWISGWCEKFIERYEIQEGI